MTNSSLVANARAPPLPAALVRRRTGRLFCRARSERLGACLQQSMNCRAADCVRYLASRFVLCDQVSEKIAAGHTPFTQTPPVNHSHGLVLFGPRRCDPPF